MPDPSADFASVSGALSEDLEAALGDLQGEEAIRSLKRALRELELDPPTVRAIMARLEELQRR